MYKVIITTGSGKESRKLLRQMPGWSDISACGKYQFFINEDVDEPDFWIVRNKYLKKPETHVVAPENTILMISEPRSIVNFPKKYRDQFGMVCTCQEDTEHRNVIYTPPILQWFVGFVLKNGSRTITHDYDKIRGSQLPEKTKLISVITSNKAFSQGHYNRIRFVEKLKAHYGASLDVFGRGFNDFENKWDVLAPYKYHIALENSSSKYYWTEKLSDCYLTSTYPIYYGCTNIGDYFPDDSYKTVDINNYDEAIKIIDKTISENEFEKSRPALEISKKLVLEEYNMFTLIANCLDRLDPNRPKSPTTLRPTLTFLDWHNFYLYFIDRNLFAIRRMFRGASRLGNDQ